MQNLLYIVQGYLLWAFDEVTGRATKRAVPRLAVCAGCESNDGGVCDECGCILKAKARVDFPLDEEGKSIGGCPKRKW